MQPYAFPQMLSRAQRGDEEALQQIIIALEPSLRRQASLAEDDDAYSYLVEWLLKAIKKYPGAPRYECKSVCSYQD